MEVKSEDMYHKKFDKLRKHTIPFTGQEEAAQMENLSIQDPETVESEMNIDAESENKSETVKMKSEKSRKSAGEAHPQLLAQLTSGPQFKPLVQPSYPISSASMASSQMAHQQPNMLQVQLNQGPKNFLPNSVYSMADEEKGSHQNGNVVLNVPKNMFSKIHPSDATAIDSYSGSQVNGSNSVAGSHHHLENMLRQNTSPRNSYVEKQYLANCAPMDPSSNHPHLKEKLINRFPKSEAVVKYEIDNDKTVQNGNVAGDFLPYHNGQQILPPGYQLRPGFESQSLMAHQMGIYSPMFSHQPGVAPQFNQHLAGMQQMVYGNTQQSRR